MDKNIENSTECSILITIYQDATNSMWEFTVFLNNLFSSPELIKSYSLFVWPLVCLAIVLFLKQSISKAIINLSDRLEEASKGGLKFGQTNTANNTDSHSPPTNLIPSSNTLDQSNISTTKKEYAESWKAILSTLSGDKEEFLRIKLVEASFTATFEKLKQNMYPEQYKALNYLETCENNSVNRIEIKKFYDKGAKKNEFDKTGYPYPQWLGFLQSYLLIEVQDSNIKLRGEGVEFLRYIEQNYPEIITALE